MDRMNAMWANASGALHAHCCGPARRAARTPAHLRRSECTVRHPVSLRSQADTRARRPDQAHCAMPGVQRSTMKSTARYHAAKKAEDEGDDLLEELLNDMDSAAPPKPRKKPTCAPRPLLCPLAECKQAVFVRAMYMAAGPL